MLTDTSSSATQSIGPSDNKNGFSSSNKKKSKTKGLFHFRSPRVLLIPANGKPLEVATMTRQEESMSRNNNNSYSSTISEMKFLQFIQKCLCPSVPVNNNSSLSSSCNNVEDYHMNSQNLELLSESHFINIKPDMNQDSLSSNDSIDSVDHTRFGFDSSPLGDLIYVHTKNRKEDARQFYLYFPLINNSNQWNATDSNNPHLVHSLNQFCADVLRIRVYGTVVLACWRMKIATALTSIATQPQQQQQTLLVKRYQIDRLVSFHGFKHIDLCRSAIDAEQSDRRKWFTQQAVVCPKVSPPTQEAHNRVLDHVRKYAHPYGPIGTRFLLLHNNIEEQC